MIAVVFDACRLPCYQGDVCSAQNTPVKKLDVQQIHLFHRHTAFMYVCVCVRVVCACVCVLHRSCRGSLSYVVSLAVFYEALSENNSKKVCRLCFTPCPPPSPSLPPSLSQT